MLLILSLCDNEIKCNKIKSLWLWIFLKF